MTAQAMEGSNFPGWVVEHGDRTFMVWAPRGGSADGFVKARDGWSADCSRTADGYPFAHAQGVAMHPCLEAVGAPVEVRTAFAQVVAEWRLLSG